MEQNMNMGSQPSEKMPVGSIISIIVIVLVLAFGAFYFFKQVPAPAEETTATTSANDEATIALSTQSTSTEIVDIQKDLNASDYSNLGAGLSNIAI